MPIGLSATPSDHVRLGYLVVCDYCGGPYSLDRHVSNVCKTCFFCLRQLRRVRRSLDIESVKTLVHDFVTSCVDYTVTLFCLPRRRTSRTSCSTFKMLQHVGSLHGTWKYDRGLFRLMHDDLHWLVIFQRMQYKLTVTVHRCLRHRAPRYLADYCVPVSKVAGCQHLQSARCHQLSVPRVCRSIFGTRTLEFTA